MAIDFDGSSGRLDVPVSALTVFTVAGRVYLDALPGASTSNGAMLGLMCHATQPAGEWSGGIGVNENGRLIGYFFDGGVHTITGGTTLSTGQWYAYAATMVSSGTCRVWLNGVSDGSDTAGSLFTGWSSGPVMRFGGTTSVNPSGFLAFLDGKVADVGIWDVELTGPELLSHAAGLTPIGIRPASLIRYIPGIREVADYKTAATLSTAGIAVADHPRVLCPTPPRMARKPAAAPAGGTIPVKQHNYRRRRVA